MRIGLCGVCGWKVRNNVLRLVGVKKWGGKTCLNGWAGLWKLDRFSDAVGTAF